MRRVLALAVLCAVPFLCADSSPDITGVWKADLEKSKIAGPPLTDYLTIIEQKTVVLNRRTQEKGPQIDENTAFHGPRGEQRIAFSFPVTGKPAVRYFQGVPTQMTASWEGNILTLNGETAGRPQTMKRTYELSSDGQTLTETTVVSANGKNSKARLF